MKNILNKLDWEKKFDNQFGNLYEADHDYRGRNRTKAIKNFIKKILQEEKASWMTEIYEQLKNKN